MAYATPEEFISRFGQQEALELTNLEDPNAASVDLLVLQDALDDASSLIDGYIQARVQLPLHQSAYPKTLIWACCDIARFQMDRDRTREEVRLRYEDRMAWLKDVSKGLVNLGLDSQDPAQSATVAPDLPSTADRATVFTDPVLTGYEGDWG